MKRIDSNQGQGVLEALLSLPLVLASGFFLTMLVYRGSLYYIADHQLHEALICTEDNSATYCELELKRRFKNVLPPQDIIYVHIYKGSSFSRGKLMLNLSPPLTLEKKFEGATLW